jgi:hypothetical protein
MMDAAPSPVMMTRQREPQRAGGYGTVGMSLHRWPRDPHGRRTGRMSVAGPPRCPAPRDGHSCPVEARPTPTLSGIPMLRSVVLRHRVSQRSLAQITEPPKSASYETFLMRAPRRDHGGTIGLGC